MANADHLKEARKKGQFRTGSEQVETARKGGIASGKARKKNADFKSAIEAALNGTYHTTSGKAMTGAEAIIQSMMKIATDPKNKSAVAAYNALQKTIGGDKSALDEMEQLARIEQIKASTEHLRKDSEQSTGESVTIIDDIGGTDGH